MSGFPRAITSIPGNLTIGGNLTVDGEVEGPLIINGSSGPSDGLVIIGPTGATGPVSFNGITTAGHPATGTWEAGTVVPSDDGNWYLCTVSGTPGTWITLGGGGAPLGELLEYLYYAPNPTNTYAGPGAGQFDQADSNHLLVTFIVPASGTVLVRLTTTQVIFDDSGGRAMSWGLMNATPALVGDQATVGPNNGGIANNGNEWSYSVVLRVEGLTPGASETLYWALGGPADNKMQVGNGGDLNSGPAVMEVYAG